MKAWKFYRSLHGRGQSLGKLAAELQTTHSHLSQVINGTRGGHTRKKLTRFLTLEETTLLGWAEAGQAVPAPIGGGGNEVPRGTSSHMEQLAEREEDFTTEPTEQPK